MLNASNFSFVIKNFNVTTSTDMCMKEVIDNFFHRILWRKIMETLKALILTNTLLNLVSKGLSFYYTVVFTEPTTT